MRLLGGRRWFGAVFLVILSAIALSGYGATVRFIRGEEVTKIDLSTFSEQSGTVAYEGPSADGDPNWKASHEYTGAPLLDIVDELPDSTAVEFGYRCHIRTDGALVKGFAFRDDNFRLHPLLPKRQRDQAPSRQNEQR